MHGNTESGAPALTTQPRSPQPASPSPEGGEAELVVIIPFASTTLDSYRRRLEEGRIPLLRRCLACGEKLHKHGTYRRHATEAGRPWEEVPIQRMRCTGCRRTVSLLPSFLRPYQSLVTSLRERLIQGRLRGRGCGAWPERWAVPCGRSAVC